MQSELYQIITQLAMSLLYTTPVIAFIIISIYYMAKNGANTEGYLILVGNIIIFLSSLASTIALLQINVYQKWGISTYSTISIGIQAFSFIGKILFVIGVFLLFRKVIKMKKSSTPTNH